MARARVGQDYSTKRFFHVTAIVLVIVAAGLVSSAVHELAEAGVIGVFPSPAVDLIWLITTDSLWSSLLGGLPRVSTGPYRGGKAAG